MVCYVALSEEYIYTHLVSSLSMVVGGAAAFFVGVNMFIRKANAKSRVAAWVSVAFVLVPVMKIGWLCMKSIEWGLISVPQ